MRNDQPPQSSRAPRGRGLVTVYVALVGVALATLEAWRAHDRPLTVVGIVVLALAGGGVAYVLSRRP
ncbi:hypothetical protein [Phenylobacterium sp.]|jgi:hypothetical protein|uniref:hypothetical protein n=1 Tax=Phenylobacterium sp. TaxID=1871053 RepID=UPI002F419B95